MYAASAAVTPDSVAAEPIGFLSEPFKLLRSGQKKRPAYAGPFTENRGSRPIQGFVPACPPDFRWLARKDSILP